MCLVNGRAIGGGAELTLMTDFRLFTPSGQLAFVQSQMGVTTGFGGGKPLVDLIGSREALKLLIGCERVDPQRALSLGLCDAIIEDEENAVEEAEKFMLKLVHKLEPEVIHAAKSIVLNAIRSQDIKTAYFNERTYFAPLWGGEANKKALGSNKKH